MGAFFAARAGVKKGGAVFAHPFNVVRDVGQRMATKIARRDEGSRCDLRVGIKAGAFQKSLSIEGDAVSLDRPTIVQLPLNHA